MRLHSDPLAALSGHRQFHDDERARGHRTLPPSWPANKATSFLTTPARAWTMRPPAVPVKNWNALSASWAVRRFQVVAGRGGPVPTSAGWSAPFSAPRPLRPRSHEVCLGCAVCAALDDPGCARCPSRGRLAPAAGARLERARLPAQAPGPEPARGRRQRARAPRLPRGRRARGNQPEGSPGWTADRRSTTWVAVGSEVESNTLTMPLFSPANTLPPGRRRWPWAGSAAEHQVVGEAGGHGGDGRRGRGRRGPHRRPKSSPPSRGLGAADAGPAGSRAMTTTTTSQASARTRRVPLRAGLGPTRRAATGIPPSSGERQRAPWMAP
jgi:hypothetical protein